MRRTVPLLYLLVLAVTAAADGSVRDIEISIPIGRGEEKVDEDEGGEEHWKPLFFAVDERERVYTPDFSNGRVTVFDPLRYSSAMLGAILIVGRSRRSYDRVRFCPPH